MKLNDWDLCAHCRDWLEPWEEAALCPDQYPNIPHLVLDEYVHVECLAGWLVAQMTEEEYTP